MASLEMATMLFTDLVGSTGMASRIGPAAADEIRREHFGLLRGAIGEAGGNEVKNLGDGLMVRFDSASAALRCAAAMQQRIARRNRRADEQLSVRIGISLGEAVREEGDYFGTPVVEAARLCAAAAGDEVLVSDLVRSTARNGDHELQPVGELKMKGFPEPVAAFRLAWELGVEQAGLPLPSRLRGAPQLSFVGRKEERARLAEITAAAQRGRRQLVLLSGEPGIGKTRFASNAALELHASGAAVLFGRGIEGIEIPYRLWAQALSHYVERGPQRVLEAHVERHGGELTRLVPQLADRVGDVPPPKQTDSETERYLLFAAAVGLLREASAERTLVVILDDLHWADSQSLALLKHLVASESDGELLVLATHRGSEFVRGHPLTRLLGDLRNEVGVERIDLGGLGSGEVGAMIEAATGYELRDAENRLVAEIIRETDGNPFFVAEVLRHLDDSGAVTRDASGRWVLARSLSELGLPQGLREVIASRVERLGEEPAQLLGIAAVIGRDFELDLLSCVTGHDEAKLLELLEPAVAGALLHEGREAGRFSFSHSLVNHTLCELMGATRRGRIHRRIGEALEELCGEEPGDRVTELAGHWLRAASPSEPRKAARYCRLAGERALLALAPQEALNWFQRATELLDQLPGVEARERCEALIGLGDSQRQVGDEAYVETLLRASAIARGLGDEDRIVRAAVANTRGFATLVGETDQRRIESLEAALDLCEGGEERACLLSLLAVELSYRAGLELRLELSGEAVRLARASGDRHALAWALARRQTAIAAPETLRERRAEAEELIALADEIDDPMLRYWAHVWRAMNALDGGDFEAAARDRKVLEEIAESIEQPIFRWVNTFAPALLSCMAGDYVQSEELANRSAELGSETGQPDALTIYAGQIHAIRYGQGRLEEIIGVQEKVRQEAPRIEAYTSAVALSYCELGRTEDARALLLDRAAEDFEVRQNLASKYTLCMLAETAARLDEPGAAKPLYQRLLPWRDQFCYTGVTMFGPVERYLGLAATCLGRYEQAEDHFERSAESCIRVAAPIWLARTRHEWASMLRRRGGPGDRDRAERLLGQALEAAEAHGCASLERRVLAMLER